MIATVDIGRVPLRDLRRPKGASPGGLRWSEVAVLAPLGATRPPNPHRAVLLAFWDDEEAAAARHRDLHPLASVEGGYHATLRPLRAHGSWPGLDDGIDRSRRVDHDGEVVVFTLGRLRISQTVRFLRTSRPAERAALTAPGFLWGTAAARPPFVATVSAWASGEAAASYAFTRSQPHDDAIVAQRAKDFHRRSAFIRFGHASEPTGRLPA